MFFYEELEDDIELEEDYTAYIPLHMIEEESIVVDGSEPGIKSRGDKIQNH